MTPDRRPATYDDRTISQLVRDVAGEWSMPPVRLDAPSWRDRVRGPRARRLAAAGGWLGRFGQAATAAVVLSVVGALIAVVLTHPPTPGASPEPSSGASPSTGVRATALPKLLVTGDEPNPSVIVVRDERGDFRRVDLATGSISGPLTGKSSESRARVAADGSVLCLCVTESGNMGGMPTDNLVTFERYDARGKMVSSAAIERFSGEPDPRDQSIFVPERPAHVLTNVSFSDDGRYGFVGWSEHAHPVWRSGIVVVNLADGSIASRFALPDQTDGADDVRRVVTAPAVLGGVGGDAVAIAVGRYDWTPPASDHATYTFDTDIFRAAFSGGTFADPIKVTAGSDCGNVVTRAGPLPGGGFWIVCTSGDTASSVMRRFGADNAAVEDIRVAGTAGVETDPTAVSPDGASLYVWDPQTGVLTRIDTASGDRTSNKGVAAADGGPLTAFGNWLAPEAAAKSWLRGALAVSPDGARVYAIGVNEGPTDRVISGSTGVFVFDAGTLQPIATWQPTADYVSVAVSPDGDLVYAAGVPGYDAAGRLKTAQQASITVFSAADGSIRLIAGQLGGDALSFLGPTVR